MAVHYVTGYNDIFHNMAAGYSNSLQLGSLPPYQTESIPPDRAMQAAKDSAAQVVRCNVLWDAIQPESANDLGRWTVSAGTGPPYDFAALRSQANALDMKVLPVIFGAPSWLGPPERKRCRPDLPITENNLYYPLPSSADAFGDFVVKVIEFFDTCGVIDAVEIWNEPNLPKGPIYIEYASRFGALLTAAITKVNAAYPNESNRKLVVSGGLGINADDSKWKPYLDVFANQCTGYAIGVHTYGDLSLSRTFPPGFDFWDRVNSVADYILERYDTFQSYVTNHTGLGLDIWVTEAGAYSSDPLSETAQSEIFKRVLGSGKGFDTRPRCGAALVHRLYPDYRGGSAPDYLGGTDRPFQTFYEYSTYRMSGYDQGTPPMPIWAPKASVGRLVTEWT